MTDSVSAAQDHNLPIHRPATAPGSPANALTEPVCPASVRTSRPVDTQR